MHHIKRIDRDQIRMISLDQMAEKDSFARVIDAFVEMLNLEELGLSYYKLNKEGRPPFHPSTTDQDMFLWLPTWHQELPQT